MGWGLNWVKYTLCTLISTQESHLNGCGLIEDLPEAEGNIQIPSEKRQNVVGRAERSIRNAMGWLRGRQHVVQDASSYALHSDQGGLAAMMSPVCRPQNA